MWSWTSSAWWALLVGPLTIAVLGVLSGVAAPRADLPQVAFIGDSLTAHFTQAEQSVAGTSVFFVMPDTPFGQAMERCNADWQAVVIAADGLTAPAWPHRDGDWRPDADGFDRLEHLLAKKPDLVVLMLGTNDALHIGQTGRAESERDHLKRAYRNGMTRLIEAVSSDTRVLLLTLPPVIRPREGEVSFDVNKVEATLVEFNGWLAALAAHRVEVDLYDYRDGVMSLPGWERYYNDDGVHFWGNVDNRWGNVLAGDQVIRAVNALLERPGWHAKSHR